MLVLILFHEDERNACNGAGASAFVKLGCNVLAWPPRRRHKTHLTVIGVNLVIPVTVVEAGLLLETIGTSTDKFSIPFNEPLNFIWPTVSCT